MPQAIINGNELFWQEVGTGEPLLLLHGFPLDHSMWRPQVDYFASRGWRVIVPDHRGFGRSALPPGQVNTMELLAEDAAALLDHLNLPGASVMGLSMGGYVSFALYRRFPQKIKALVLADTKAAPDDPVARENRYKLVEVVRRQGSSAARDVMLPKMFTPERYVSDPAMVGALGEVMLNTAPETIMATLPGIAERPDAQEQVAGMNLPTLVIHGEEDTLMPVEQARQMSGLHPGCLFVSIAGAGHMSNLEQPEVFNGAVEAFLNEAVKI